MSERPSRETCSGSAFHRMAGRKKTLFAGLARLLLAAGTHAVFGQSFTSLDGRMSDATGGAIPGAAIELINMDTGLKRSTSTERTGLYRFAQVLPGNYSLRAKAQGFAQTILEALQLV